MRSVSMIAACDLDAPAIMLPGEGFRGRDQGATDALPLMIDRNSQGS
jgi:hypothetical protein